jgi:hypothetical protein
MENSATRGNSYHVPLFPYKKWKTVKATERDEVKGFGFLEPLQAVGHGAIVTPLGPCREPAHRDKAAMNGAQFPILG